MLSARSLGVVASLLAGSLIAMTDVAAAQFKLEKVNFPDLSGWRRDNHQEALQVLVNACSELAASGVGFSRKAVFSGTRSDWLPVCEQARQTVSTNSNPRSFFESTLVPLRIIGSIGQITGYFEPEYEGSRLRTKSFSVPVLARPDDLTKLPARDVSRLDLTYGRIVNGRGEPYLTRKEIEQGALEGRGLEIAYLKSWEDLFFMQVQGSGRLKLRDGNTIRLAYSAKSGLPYTSIGKVLIERGFMTRQEMSMQALRKWLQDNPQQAREIMWRNESYVFFRELKGHGTVSGPVGAQKLPLSPLRSLAVDRAFWALGVPVWVSTSIYVNGRLEEFDRIMVAQDTGSAIRGPQRADIFMGTGQQAGLDAGLMDEQGLLHLLVPPSLAKRLVQKYGQ